MEKKLETSALDTATRAVEAPQNKGPCPLDKAALMELEVPHNTSFTSVLLRS